MKKLAVLLLLLPLGGGDCNDGDGTFTREDAGTGPGVIYSYEDIGAPCNYDPARPTYNPTNTCQKAGLTCVIASSDGMYREFGHFLYEAIPLFTRLMPDGKDEGICTLVSQPGHPLPACPGSTVAVQLSSGQAICMKLCTSSAECNRDGYVCDYKFMDSSTYNYETGDVAPLPIKLCAPACTTDLPYCTRTFLLPDGQGGDMLLVNSSDLAGYRECQPLTGLCEDVVVRGGGFVGDQCEHSSACRDGMLCIGGPLYGAPVEHGFCANQCNPAAEGQNPPQPTGCQPGQGCEFFLDIGYCFPDCVNNVCGGMNQVCAYADPGAAGLREGQEWLLPRCIPCELSSLPCASSVDAGVSDAAAEDAG